MGKIYWFRKYLLENTFIKIPFCIVSRRVGCLLSAYNSAYRNNIADLYFQTYYTQNFNAELYGS